MSKPGEMVQLLRDDYEQTLEEYRLLRNKFLIAVPGMNLDRERDLYNLWKSDLHLNSIIDSAKPAPSVDPGALREAIGRVVDGIPACVDGNFIIDHCDSEGEFIGSETVDPVAIISSIHGALRAALGKEGA